MLSYADWDPGLDELWGGGWDERGAVSRTIITCFKDGFSFLHQDMKMGPEAQSLNGAMALLYKIYYDFRHAA